MNFTDNYIKMCERNPDVQEEWEPEDGDWVGYKGDVELGISKADLYQNGCCNVPDIEFLSNEEIEEAGKRGLKKGYIFFPDQEWLQGRFKGKYDIWNCLATFYWWVKSSADGIVWQTTKPHPSWQELWMAFMMLEKHNKVWNDGEWINA